MMVINTDESKGSVPLSFLAWKAEKDLPLLVHFVSTVILCSLLSVFHLMAIRWSTLLIRMGIVTFWQSRTPMLLTQKSWSQIAGQESLSLEISTEPASTNGSFQLCMTEVPSCSISLDVSHNWWSGMVKSSDGAKLNSCLCFLRVRLFYKKKTSLESCVTDLRNVILGFYVSRSQSYLKGA